MSNLLSYFPQFIEALRAQLEDDDTHWGDTWKRRSIVGQEARTEARFTDYFDQFRATGTSVPWLKIAGGAFICWVRELREKEKPQAQVRSQPTPRPVSPVPDEDYKV